MAWFKKLTVPESNQTKEIDVAGVWIVRWWGRRDAFSSGLIKEAEAFLSEQAAADFKLALENAFKLVRNTDHTTVIIEKSGF